jgi:hexosaminidase
MARMGRCKVNAIAYIPHLIAAAFLTFVSPQAHADAAPILLPLPQLLQMQSGVLSVPGAFHVNWKGTRNAQLENAVTRFNDDIYRLRGAPRSETSGASLTISCQEAGPRYPSFRENEAYTLTISTDGVTLTSATPLGVLHGFATLRQIVFSAAPDAPLPALTISDSPRFAWRGILIDVARHFISVDTLKRQIDAMELAKFNVLHLHLSDNEGFRVESLRYPKLQQIASHGQYYTQAQIRDLVAYAADRGIRVMPEFDVPAHNGALLKAYPELMSAPANPANPFASGDTTLNPASENTYSFLANLFQEMAALFPDRYFHMGGDEVGSDVWANLPAGQSFMNRHGLKSQADLEAYFHKRVHDLLAKDGKTVIGWEEAANGPLPPDTVVQAWRTSNATKTVTAKGYQTIASAGYYLDSLMPASFYYKNDPLDPNADGFSPAEGEAARAASPLAASVVLPLVLKPLPPLTPEEESRIMGAEGALWSELISDEMVDARLWPRALALAERFWSPSSVRDPNDMYGRATIVMDEFRLLGLEDKANQMRMAARLAPGDSSAVSTLLDCVGPVRNAAHNHGILAFLRGDFHPKPQSFNTLADTAPADSLIAERFNIEAQKFADGDHTFAANLKSELQIWRDNDARFSVAANGHPNLATALPISAEVATLTQVALNAIQALETGHMLTSEARSQAETALAKAESEKNASARPIFAFMHPQPAADLIIAILPGVRALLAAAKG